MAEKPRNLLIANGHELIGQLSWPKGGGKKWLPYSINDAREALHNQILEVAEFAGNTQERFAPRREITAKVILHPSFLAKSYFPSTILRDSGLSILGSRPVNITPRVGRSETPKNQETASIFVSGTAESFRAMDDSLLSTYTSAGRQEQFARIELICPYQADEKLRISVDTRWPDYIHVTMHATEADADILTAFKNLVEELGGRISGRGFRFVPGLTFVAVQIPPDKIHQVAQFTRIRLVRSLPEIQEEWKLTPAITKAFGAVETPTEAPKSSIKTAIFDGGIANAFPGYATEISSAQQPSSSIKDLSHGVNVTSAFLYGHVKPDDKYLPVPFCHVDHHRVLPTSDNPEQALDILDRVITAVAADRKLTQ